MLPREVRPATSPVTGRQISPAVILLRARGSGCAPAAQKQFRLYTSAANHLACHLCRQLGFTELRRFRSSVKSASVSSAAPCSAIRCEQLARRPTSNALRR